MNNIIKVLIISLIIIIIGVGIYFYINNSKDKNNNVKKESMDISKNIKIKINNNEYQVTLEDNPTVSSLMDLLPLTINMKELNGNEKYFYLDKSLPTNKYTPEHIEKGDIMLYEDNCLVIFYKSFNTDYSYTKIGHIKNLDDLNSDDIEVEITK